MTESILKCPKCGYDYVHFDELRYAIPHDERLSEAYISLSADTIKVVPDLEQLPCRNRELFLEIHLSCESGHKFKKILYFHKGQMFEETEVD